MDNQNNDSNNDIENGFLNVSDISNNSHAPLLPVMEEEQVLAPPIQETTTTIQKSIGISGPNIARDEEILKKYREQMAKDYEDIGIFRDPNILSTFQSNEVPDSDSDFDYDNYNNNSDDNESSKTVEETANVDKPRKRSTTWRENLLEAKIKMENEKDLPPPPPPMQRCIGMPGPILARDEELVNKYRQELAEEYKAIGIDRNPQAPSTWTPSRGQKNAKLADKLTKSSNIGYQNSTLTFFKKRTSSKLVNNHEYKPEVLKKWLNYSTVDNITLVDRFCFYFNSLYNNKVNKMKFIEYMGELTMMYEDTNKLMIEVKEIHRNIMNNETSRKNKGPLYFLDEGSDDIEGTFRRIDVFLRRHMQFMKLCSAPVDLFLDNYFTARSNCCGLIEIYEEDIIECNNKSTKKYYIDYLDCQDKDLQHDFYLELQGSFFEGADRIYSTSRRVAALHNIMGELHAISEFIKTTVEMNDQLLFRLLMLLGSFFTLLGEFVWNTHLKQIYYE